MFPSVLWQRCQFQLQQNAGAYVPRQDMAFDLYLPMKRSLASVSWRLSMEISEEWVTSLYLTWRPQPSS